MFQQESEQTAAPDGATVPLTSTKYTSSVAAGSKRTATANPYGAPDSVGGKRGHIEADNDAADESDGANADDEQTQEPEPDADLLPLLTARDTSGSALPDAQWMPFNETQTTSCSFSNWMDSQAFQAKNNGSCEDSHAALKSLQLYSSLKNSLFDSSVDASFPFQYRYNWPQPVWPSGGLPVCVDPNCAPHHLAPSAFLLPSNSAIQQHSTSSLSSLSTSSPPPLLPPHNSLGVLIG